MDSTPKIEQIAAEQYWSLREGVFFYLMMLVFSRLVKILYRFITHKDEELVHI